MKRVVIPELLDIDQGTPAEVTASLKDLRRINRWFGSISTVCDLVKNVAKQSEKRRLTMLDVAGASGDIAAAAQRSLQRCGIQLYATLLDRAASHLANGNIPSAVGDALALPFCDKSFDLVACSTFAHHLEPEQIIQFVNEALRVARLAVLINDLRRHPLHLALVYGGFPLFRSRLTRHDGPVSVRRSYTTQEMRVILQKTNAQRIQINHHYLFRMGVIAWTT